MGAHFATASVLCVAAMLVAGCGKSDGAGPSTAPSGGGSGGGSREADANTGGTIAALDDAGDAETPGADAEDADTGPAIDPACIGVPDECAAPGGGVTIRCRKRFLYGVNYAWKTDPVYGQDFGETNGVSSRRNTFLADMQGMAAYGVDVVRWWMFGRLANGFTYTDGVPDGLTATTKSDIEEALSVASEAGVHLQLCIFSFDTFKAANVLAGHRLMRDIIADPIGLAMLMGAVRQVAETVEASPHRAALLSWDVINEPEWATSGQDSFGDKPFEPNANVTAAPYADMEAFIAKTVETLRAVREKPITVGAAAYCWAHPWDRAGLDFFTFHMYDWINKWYPYTKPPSAFGVVGKPVVLGEFPIQGLTNVPYKTLLDALLANGYAGATAWAMNDDGFDWTRGKLQVKAWADTHPCITAYGDLTEPADAGDAGDAGDALDAGGE
jgi:hypothetical protein